MPKQATQIQSAALFDPSALRAAMVSSFADYPIPMHLSQDAFDAMMRQRGLHPALSKVVTHNGQIVAIWLISVRQGQAYLIVSGTDPAHRSNGHSKRMGQACLADLGKHGIRSFQTEVLDGNEVALGLYTSLGMAVRRKFSCFVVEEAPTIVAPHDVTFAKLSRDMLEEAANLRDWLPSWQNSDASMMQVCDDVRCAYTTDRDGLTGYALVQRSSGNVSQLAVRRDLRGQGIARSLLSTLFEDTAAGRLKFINVPADADDFAAFMKSVNATQTTGQRELWIDLSSAPA